MIRHSQSDAKYFSEAQAVVEMDFREQFKLAQVMRYAGGEALEKWKAKMRQILLDRQDKTGPSKGSYWNRINGRGGRLLRTAYACMLLQSIDDKTLVKNEPEAIHKAVTDGLEWLYRQQDFEGGWGYDTGTVLLAFLQHRQAHQKGDPAFQNVVQSGINYLLKTHEEVKLKNGKLGIRLLSNVNPLDEIGEFEMARNHAIATRALCKAYQLTRDPMLQKECQQAVDFLIDLQSEDGEWNNAGSMGSFLLTLQIAKSAGMKVPSSVIEKWPRVS